MHTALNTLEHTLQSTLQNSVPRIITATPSTAAQRAPSGAFALRAGRAMTLQPHTAATLRITQGAAWVTLTSLPGDHFLSAGDSLPIRACDRVVMEAWHVPAYESLYFDWDVAPVQVVVRDGMAVRGRWLGAAASEYMSARPLRLRLLSPNYCDAVLTPLADLRSAVVLGGTAAARLLVGLVAWTAGKVLGKVLDTAIFLATSRARASTV